MLHGFAFSNFQSFRERTEVSWRLDQRDAMSGWTAQAATGERLSTVMAVIGPNASGKTGLLKPVAFVHWFISHSFSAEPTAPLPLAVHPAAADQPFEFEAEFDFDGKLWRYTLTATPQRVLHEALYMKRQRMGYVFVREWDTQKQVYAIKQQDFGFAASEAAKVRPNASLIATAAQYGVPLALRMATPSVWSNLHQYGRIPQDVNQLLLAAQYFAGNQAHHAAMTRLLTHWDLGLSDVQLRELEVVTNDNQRQTLWQPFGFHQLQDGSSFRLDFTQESSGTQGAFVLLSRLLPALENGGLAVIDEFENDLHPHMLEPILDLFADPSTNPHKAQLLFTCHAIEVLNILHKSQVMLVEKSRFNQSSAWKLDSVEGIRNDHNHYAKYMAGAYGAVPEL
jgi:hypothetical protein